tara:strand:+ start:4464 stop:6251 length:1788 start_codon:yes stop_codon:yes gene_type:complete
MILNIKLTFKNFFKLINLIVVLVRLSDGNLKKFFKSISFSLINLFSDLLSLGSLFPLIYLILEKDSFFEKFNFLTKYDVIYKLESNNLLFFFISIVLILILIKFVVSTAFNNFIWKYTYSIQKKLEKIVFNKILLKKYNYFTDNPKGNLISLCKEETIRSMEVIRSFILGLVEVIALIIIISFLFYSFPITSILILFLLTIFSFVFISIIRVKTTDISKKRSNLHKYLIKMMNESFSAIKEIKFNNLQKLINTNFNDLNENLTKTDAKAMTIVSLPRIFFEFLLLFSAVLILLAFILLDLEKSVMISHLTIFSLCAYRLFPAFSRIHVNYQMIRLRVNSFNTIFKFIENSEINLHSINKPKFEKIEDNVLISLRKIDFQHEREGKISKIFSNLNFNINKSQKIAIIGESGSGKSTFLELALSLLEPNGGCNIYNQLYYKDLDYFSENTGYVYQEQIIFNDSLANNITLNFDKKKEEYDPESLEKLYKSADNSLVSQFITNSNLFNFELTENGSNLSAGQRQRIFIARALFKASKLLIFDEPTSNLDPETENKIIENIFNNYQKIALVMCTHRHSNLKKFDEIYKIINGELVKLDV